MKFNLKDELRMPRNLDNNKLEEPKTNEFQRSPSYYEAMKKDQRARENLRSVNGIRPTAVFSGTGLQRGPDQYLKQGQGKSVSGLHSESTKITQSLRKPVNDYTSYQSVNQSMMISPEVWSHLRNQAEQQIVNFLPQSNFIQPKSKKQIRNQSAQVQGLRQQKEDPRVKIQSQIQKINSSFYGTLKANTIHKQNYDELVMSNQAKLLAPFPTGTDLRPYSSAVAHSQQNPAENETVNAMFSTSSSFYPQAFKANNLKYHLIRQLLEQKPLEEIQQIRNELQTQQKENQLKEEQNSSSLNHTRSVQTAGQQQLRSKRKQMKYDENYSSQLLERLGGAERRQVYGSNSTRLISAAPQNESQMTNRIAEANQQNQMALSIDLSENSQAVKPIETQKLEVIPKKQFRPPSSSSSSSSESDDVELFIEQDEKVKLIQNDLRPDATTVEEVAVNFATKLTDTRIGDQEITTISQQKESGLKHSINQSISVQERRETTKQKKVKKPEKSQPKPSKPCHTAKNKSTTLHFIQRQTEQDQLKLAEKKINNDDFSAIQTRPFVYKGVPVEYQTDVKTQVIRDRKDHLDQAKFMLSRKGMSCADFNYKQKVAFSKLQNTTSNQFSETGEVIHATNQIFGQGRVQPVYARAQASSIQKQTQNVDQQQKKPPKHKSRQTEPNLHLTAALSSLDIRNDNKRLKIADFDAKFTQLSGKNSKNLTQTSSVRLLKQNNTKFNVDSAVVHVSDQINQKGYTDNKNLKPKQQNELYQTLLKEHEERERLRRIIMSQDRNLGDQNDQSINGLDGREKYLIKSEISVS